MQKKIIIFITLFLLVLISPQNATAIGSYSGSVSTSSGSIEIRYVYFHPSENLELRPVLAQNQVGKVEALDSMAKRNQAVVAINGTFFNAYDAKDLQPMGGLMINRDFTHYRGGPTAMGISISNELSFVPTKEIKIVGGINGSYEWPNKWYAWFINHLPTSKDEIVIFTPKFRSKDLNVTGYRFVVVNNGKVTAITSNKATIPAQGFVIAYGPNAQNDRELAKFKVGDTVQYDIEFPSILNKAYHMLSSGPKLVTGGKVTIDFQKEGITDPKLTTNVGLRSFIGVKKDQTIVMGTVSSVTVRQLGQIMVQLGLVEAMNLDGGASSGLYFNGKYLTSPGRLLSNSLIVVKKERSPRVEVNGRELFFDALPFIENQRTMVPVRGVFETLGAQVGWDATNQRVYSNRIDTSIEMWVAKNQAKINNEPVNLDAPPVIRNNRTFVPLRFISEALGAEVTWDGGKKLISIKSNILSAETHFKLGKDLLAQGSTTGSLYQLELASKLNPLHKDTWIVLGRIYVEQKEYGKAIHAYQQVNDQRVFIALGWAAYSDHQFDIAIKSFNGALKYEETKVNGHYGLGVTYLHHQVNQQDLAKEHFQKVIQLAPESTQAKEAIIQLERIN